MLNLIAFLILNAMMLVFMFRYSARLKDPLNSNRYLMLEGVEMFFVILMATGTIALSSAAGGRGVDGGGFNLQAIRLLLLEIFAVLSLFMATEKPKWGIGTIAYLIYLLWITYTLTYAPSFNYGFRYILKYLYPFLIMLAASAIVRDEQVFLSCCVWARRIAFLSAVIGYIPGLNTLFAGMFWYLTGLTIHYATITCISLALYFFYGKDKKDLIIAFLFVLPTILTVHRSGLLAMFCGIAAFMFFKFRWISLPYIAGVLAIGLAIIFYVPSFHQKMFWKDTEQELTVQDLRAGNISEDDIRNNGRKATWEILKSEYYKGHELKGSGIGSCQKFLYEHPGMVKQTHGDYVQMQCDTGNIGMWLYIAVALAVCAHCAIVCFSPHNPDFIKACAMIAAGGLVACYAGMYSENVVTYTMATTSYPFAFYGMLLGMRTKAKSISQ